VIQAEAPLEQFALDHPSVDVVPVPVVRRRLVDAAAGVGRCVAAVLVVRKLLAQFVVAQSGHQFDGAPTLVGKVIRGWHGYHSTAKDSVSYAK